VPQRFGFSVERLLLFDVGEQLFVDSIGVQKIRLNLFPGAPILHRLLAQLLLHRSLQIEII
jgi:hypothetical protein